MAADAGPHAGAVEIVANVVGKRFPFGDLMGQALCFVFPGERMAVRAGQARLHVSIVGGRKRRAGVFRFAFGVALQAVLRRDGLFNQRSLHPSVGVEHFPVRPGIGHDRPFREVPGTFGEIGMIGSGGGIGVSKHRARNIAQSGARRRRPAVIAAVELLAAPFHPVRGEMADQTVRLHCAAGAKGAFAVRRETGTVIAVLRRSGCGFARHKRFAAVGPPAGAAAEFHRSAARMAGAAGRRLDFMPGAVLARADPVIGGQVHLADACVFLGGKPRGGGRRQPAAEHARRKDPGLLRIITVFHHVVALLKMIAGRDRGIGMAGAAGFLRTVGINTVEGRRDSVSLFVSQPDVRMRSGRNGGQQTQHRNPGRGATIRNHENPQH